MSSDLLNKLKKNNPALNFLPAKVFAWSPKTQTIFYNLERLSRGESMSLLHEFAHALLEHQEYYYDVELLRMEVQAWKKTMEISDQYDVLIKKQVVDGCLETYRDWLDARSHCPTCEQYGLQQVSQNYRCLMCETQWRVPVRQTCAIKRWRVVNPPKTVLA